MGAVRLGKNVLRWCGNCNLPILERKECEGCGSETSEIELTPPGDCRPAFPYDFKRMRAEADRRFGEGCGELLLPEDRIAILSRTPSLDRMDEIVADGKVLGAFIFDPPFGERLVLRPAASERMLPRMRRGRVIADQGALPSIRSSSNLMGPGVISADDDISVGDEVAVLSPDGDVVATGLARKSSHDMRQMSRGVAVKVRWSVSGNATKEMGTGRPNDWKEIVSANRSYIEENAEKAKIFIRDLVAKYNLPVAVSFSGGKDSLATLNLALESGIRPSLLFADTGLELDETIEEVRRISEETGLELLIEEAEEAFWDSLPVFGPPGKDFRWCCKICKLGPATRIISKNFPSGVLSLIGQRSYESEQRMRKGAVWRNPWVPGQIGASPIQRWNALLVWLYIFSRGLRYNPWYERGLDRIGCYMCPSSDIAELRIVEKYSPKYDRWSRYLRSYRNAHDLPEEWDSLALWRWRRLPPAMKNRLNDLGLELDAMKITREEGPLRLRIAQGYRPCDDGGLSVEGVFSRSLKLNRIANLLNMIGPVEFHERENIATTGDIVVFGEGAIKIKDADESSIRERVDDLEQIAIRAMYCVGCGVCVGRCDGHALQIREDRIWIDPDICTHCGECLGDCPVLRFGNAVEL